MLITPGVTVVVDNEVKTTESQPLIAGLSLPKFRDHPKIFDISFRYILHDLIQ